MIDRRELKQRPWPCQVACGDRYQPSAKWGFAPQAPTEPRQESEAVQQASAVFLIRTLGWRRDSFAGGWKPLSAGVTVIDFRGVE